MPTSTVHAFAPATDQNRVTRFPPRESLAASPPPFPLLAESSTGRVFIRNGPLPPSVGTGYVRAVFWLTRPPYLRWAAVVLVVAAAFVWDLRGRSGVPHPFAARAVAAGEALDETAIVWRTIPRGLMVAPELAEAVAGRAIESGEPIIAGALGRGPIIPAGWWSVPIAMPADAVPGTPVRLVITEPPLEVDGIVVASGETELLGMSDAGLVAVPEEATRPIAAAALAGTLLVLLRP